MATITTSVFLDEATGTRTAGEAWTMNGGAVLTIRTDTRWHAKSPASMTGSIGATLISATQGGGIIIDSTSVRWLPFDNGDVGMVVPPINSIITGSVGGVGIFLGVWENYTSAPKVIGSAMPVTGYIKFLSVSSGFVDNEDLSVGVNLLCKANGVDRQGWIEIVQRTAVANTVPRLGFFRTRGGWFVLDQKTSGNPNDVIQIPTNGGGVNTHVPGVWIETAENSDVWEFYPAIRDTWFLAANLSTDIRSKFVQTIGNGQVRIGYDGTANAGFVPPANCRIRIPSNIGRQSSSAGGDANNLVPHATIADRPDWTTTSSGVIDFEYFLNDWYHLFTTPFQVTHKHCTTFDIISTSNNGAPIILENTGTGAWLGTSIPLTLTANSFGGIVKDCKFYRGAAASNGHVVAVTTSNDYVFNNVETGVIQYARSTGMSFSLSQCINLSFNNCSQTNASFQIATCFGTRINNHDHTDRFTGVTNATTGMYCISVLTSSNDTKVDGVTFGKGGIILNVNPYLSPFYSINSSNTIFRNAGTRTTPLSVQAGFAPIYACHDAGVNTNLKFQRIYLEATRTGNYLTVNTSKNISFENISGTVGSVQTLALNTMVKGIRTASNSVTGGASVYGTHTFDLFVNDTTGRIWWAMNEPTGFSKEFVKLTLAGTAGGFTSAGEVSMQTIGDEFIIESPYYILGHTGFANTAPTLTGTNTGNFSYEYDIDINDGNGFTGIYKTLNEANLSSETVSPSLGFKLRLKITCVIASLTNAITYVRIDTTSTFVSQRDCLYDLDEYELTITGLIDGSKVAFISGGTEILVDKIKTATNSIVKYKYSGVLVNNSVDVAILKAGYVYEKIITILQPNNYSIPINQKNDLAYITSTSVVSFDGMTHRIVANPTITNINVQSGIYSAWVNWALTNENLKYESAIRWVGGDRISTIKDLGLTFFLLNNWRIRPDEDDYKLTIEGNIYTDPSGSSITVPTLIPHTITIELSVSNLVDSTLAQMSEIEYASYNGGVTLDPVNGTDSSTYPYGTPLFPCKTVANSYAIRMARGFKKIFLLGDLTLSGIPDGVFNNLLVKGGTGFRLHTITMDNVLVTNCTAENLNITGVFKNGSTAQAICCNIYDTENIDLTAKDCFITSGIYSNTELCKCQIDGNIKIKDGGRFSGVNVVFNGDLTNIDFNGGVGVVSLDCDSGYVEMLNSIDGCLSEFNIRGGEIDLNANCIGGEIYIEGYGKLYNNSAMTIKANNLLTKDIWDSQTSEYQIPGSTGEAVASSGGDNKETIYEYFTTDNREDTFKVDISELATQVSVNAIPITPLLAANYTAPDNVGIAAIKAKTDTLVNTDLTGIATSAEVGAIPTNPLLTNDTRLNRLDADVSTRLAAVDYVTPANADIVAIKAKTDVLENTDLTNVAKKDELEKVKKKTDMIPGLF